MFNINVSMNWIEFIVIIIIIIIIIIIYFITISWSYSNSTGSSSKNHLPHWFKISHSIDSSWDRRESRQQNCFVQSIITSHHLPSASSPSSSSCFDVVVVVVVVFWRSSWLIVLVEEYIIITMRELWSNQWWEWVACLHQGERGWHRHVWNTNDINH